MPAELANLPTAQLQELLECDELLEEFVLGLPHMKLLGEECDKLVQGNVALASEYRALGFFAMRQFAVKKKTETNLI